MEHTTKPNNIKYTISVGKESLYQLLLLFLLISNNNLNMF